MNSISIMIMFDSIQHNLDYCTYLLNLFNIKLNLIDVKLVQVLIVTEKHQVLEQFNLMNNSKPSSNWIFIISTTSSNDFLINDLLKTNKNYEDINIFNNCQVPLINKKIFILNEHCFQTSLATCLKYILKLKSKSLALSNKDSFNELLGILKDQSVSFKEKHSNYFEKFIELETDNFSALDMCRSLSCDFLEDNFVNADYYLYENFNKLPSDELDITFLRKKFDQKNFEAKLKTSIEIIEKCYAQYRPDEVCVSFNGGKDCCIVLYLLYAVALRLGIKLPLHAIYIEIKNEFKEMTDFIKSLKANTYKKSLVDFIIFSDTESMKSSLSKLQIIRPEIKAILIGTRRSDGDYFKNLESFAYTDGDWPRYMRVNPILDWSFSEVWYFLRILKLPYCPLYDCGYTSIDNSINTVPNKNLICENGVDYLPAWRLENEDTERYSRKKVNSTKN